MRLAATLLLVLAASASFADPLKDAMQEYAEFATYDAGIILPEQITEEIFAEITFVDTRTELEFTAATIPGATHIEWREIFGRLDEIPANRKVILFCNTGALSAQAAFGLRVLGRENVLVLQTGYLGWLENAAYRP